MGVYIKGMRMPEKCPDCNFESEHGFCLAKSPDFCGYTDELVRPDWCPLVDLGKHGDLIDRDELRAEFPEPIDIIDPQQALVHITGVWAEIDCADAVVEAEDSK